MKFFLFLKKYFFKVLFSILLSILLFECFLQIAAFITWRTYHRVNPGTHGGSKKVVLCIGDSYTYGIGSGTPEGTYPAQLQKLMGDNWTIVNAGWPGQNSHDALAKLETQLHEYKPTIVLIMIGTNDSWSRPDLFSPSDGLEITDSFPWRWRTRRLILILRARFAHDQKNNMNARAPESAEELMAAGWKALSSRDFETAERYFNLCIQKGAQNPYPHGGLVSVYMLSGRQQLAARELDWLKAAYARNPNEHAGMVLEQSLLDVGKRPECLQILDKLVQEYPDNAWVWKDHAWAHFLDGAQERALQSINKALTLISDSDPGGKAYLLRMKSRIVSAQNANEAIGLAVEAYLLDRNLTEFTVSVQTIPKWIQRTEFEELLEKLPVSKTERSELTELYLQATNRNTEKTKDILRAHLLHMIARCRLAGARPILLSYPFVSEPTESVINDVSIYLKVPQINLYPVFEKELKTKRREELFVPDGHCSDEGYGLIASIVAERIKSTMLP